jgi:putative spermidine/putrescine transport system substrate-binding protein
MVSFANKSALRGLLAVAATASLVGMARAEDTVTFVGWGGNGQDMMAKHWCQPFTDKTGIKCIQDGPTDYGKIKAMVEAGNTVWDVVDVEVAFAQQAGAQGLLEPLDYSIIDASRVDPAYVFEYGIGSMTWSWVNAYNKSELNGQEPHSWADFFDTKKYPGGRSVTKWIAPGMLEAALIADGVAPDKLYPLDLDRAFAKFDSIKSDIVWWSTASEAQQQVTSGEAVMSMLWSGRAVTASQDPNVGVSWDQNLLTNETVIVPKGTKNKEAAMKLINQIVTAESQAGYANEMGYGPVNLDSGPLITAEAAKGLPDAHTEGQIFVDPIYWRENIDAVSERWYAWQAQ